jgi:hypothetical protein
MVGDHGEDIHVGGRILRWIWREREDRNQWKVENS